MDKKYYIVQLILTGLIFVAAIADLLLSIFKWMKASQPTWTDHFCDMGTIIFLALILILEYIQRLKKDKDGKHGRN